MAATLVETVSIHHGGYAHRQRTHKRKLSLSIPPPTPSTGARDVNPQVRHSLASCTLIDETHRLFLPSRSCILRLNTTAASTTSSSSVPEVGCLGARDPPPGKMNIDGCTRRLPDSIRPHVISHAGARQGAASSSDRVYGTESMVALSFPAAGAGNGWC